MPRGGARKGAGRKKDLSFSEEVTIGALCEKRHQDIVRQRVEAEISCKTRKASKQWKKAHKVPVCDRKDWLESQDGQDYLEDIRGAMQEDQGIDLVDDDSNPASVLQIQTKRPKGFRKPIISSVAATTGLKESTVDKCWKKYRKIDRETKI